PARTKRLADADFARAFRNTHKHDVHDYDAAYDERNRSDADHDDEKAGANVLPEGEKRIASFDCEIVLRVVSDVMAAAHNLPHFVNAILNFLRRACSSRNPQRIILRAKVLLVGSEWKNDPVVQRSAERGALLFSYTDDLTRKTIPADFLADWVYSREKILDNVHANGADRSGSGEIGVRN